MTLGRERTRVALKTGEIRALITGDYTSFKRATTAAKREAKDTRDELSKPITISGSAAPLLKVLGGLPATGVIAGAGMAAGLVAPIAAFGAIGAAAVAMRDDVQQHFIGMAETVTGGVKAATAPMAPYVAGVADQVEERFLKLRPRLDAIFAEAGPQLSTFVGGLLDFVDNAMPGMETAVKRGQPIVDGFAKFFGRAGKGVSDMLTEWSTSSHSAGQAMDDLGGTVEDLLGFLGKLLAIVSTEFGPRFTQVKNILGDVEEIVVDVAGGALPIFSNALGLVLDGVAAVLRPVGALAEEFGNLPAPIQAALLAIAAYRLIQSRTASEGASVGERLREPWRRFGDEVRVQTALAAMSGQQNLSRLAASMAVVEARVPFIHRMAEAYRTASSSVEQYVRSHVAVGATSGVVDTATGAVARLGGAAAGTAAALGSGLRSAASGLVGVLGGPWGIALAAGATLLGIWSAKQQEAAAKQRESVDAAHDYARALRESNGVLTESIRKQAADRAEKAGALKTAKDLGISLSSVTNAVLGQGNALDGLRTKLRGIIEAHSQQVIVSDGAKSGIVHYKTEVDETGRKAQDLLTSLGNLNSEWTNGTSEARRISEAMGELNGEMANGPARTSLMATAIVEMGKAGSSAEDKIAALKRALDDLVGAKHTVEEANQAVNDSLRDMGESFKTAAGEARNAKTGLLDSSGAINTVTEAGSRLQDNVMALSDAYRQQYSAAFEAAQAQGKSLPEASAIAASAANTTRERFIKVAEQFLKSRQAAEKLAAQYDLMPPTQATQITQPGMTNAQIAMNMLRDYVLKVPGDKSIIVSSNAAPVIDTVKNLGFQVQTLKDGSFKIIADTATARNQVESFVRDSSGKVITIRTNVVSGVSSSSAGGMKFQASGQVMEYYAAGGLRPMSASVPAIVGSYRRTGVQRVIGDNPRYDELFLPLDRFSARSQDLLDEGIRRMRPEWFSRPATPMIGAGSSSYDYSRRTTNNIYGHSSSDIVQQLDERERREALLYGA